MGKTLEMAGVLVGALAAMVAFLAALVKGGGMLLRTARRVGRFLDDVAGELARPGFPARPGLMERVEAIEHRLGGVEAQLRRNGGSSVADAVSRIATAVGTEPIPPES